jgi:hypothetical protein
MKKLSSGFIKNLRYFCLIGVITFGLITIIGTGGGNGDGDSDLVTEFDVPIADITVDGDRDDWATITPAATDVEGDDTSTFTGADLKELYIAQSSDGKTIYIMMSFWDGPPNPTLASSYTTDGNEEWPNVAMGYAVFFDHNLDGIYEGDLGARFDPSSSEWFPNDTPIPGVIENAEIAAGEVLEFSFLSSEMGSPAQTYFKGNVTYSAFIERRENIPEFGHWLLIYF